MDYSSDFSDSESNTSTTPPSPTKSTIKSTSHSTPAQASSKKATGSNKRAGGKSRPSPKPPVAAQYAPSPAKPRFVSSSRSRALAELQSRLSEREKELEQATQELKTLQQIQRRQDRALQQYEGSHADIPALIARREEEIRSLSTHLKTTKDKLHVSEIDLKKANKKVLELQNTNEKLTALVEDKNLGEKDSLLQRIKQLEEEIKEKDAKIGKLEKGLELEQKLRLRHEKALQSTDKGSNTEIASMRETIQALEDKLFEKERQLAHAKMSRGPSISASSIRPKVSDPSPTPQPKAAKLSPAKAASPVKSTFITSDDEVIDDIPVDTERHDREQQHRVKIQQETEAELARVRSETERRKEAEEYERREREAREHQDRLEKDRREQEERERKERELREFERYERERKEAEDRRLREAEERERQRKEQERQQAERDRAERESREAIERAKEERRKKDELLQKLAAMDQAQTAAKPIEEAPVVAKAAPKRANASDWLLDPPPKAEKVFDKSDPFGNLAAGKPAYPEMRETSGKRQSAAPSESEAPAFFNKPKRSVPSFLSDDVDSKPAQVLPWDQPKSRVQQAAPAPQQPAASGFSSGPSFPWEAAPSKKTVVKSRILDDEDDGLESFAV